MSTARVFKLAFLTTLAGMAILLGRAPHQAVADRGVVAASGSHFVHPDGSAFFLLGANYVGGPDRSWTMWQDELFDVGLVEGDLLKARSAGLNTVRVFVRQSLQRDLAGGRWGKLDAVVTLAEKHGLYLIVTLYDYRDDDLAAVAELDKAIAQHYAGRATVLAYDLKNEPQLQDLAVAQYPGSAPPLQTDVLIQHYGERMTQEEAKTWRQSGEGKNLIPSRFSDRDAYVYANNYCLYKEFLKDAGAWVAARNYEVSILDYIESSYSTKWQLLLDVLDQTLAAWLNPQIEAIRMIDGQHLITVGYSNAVLAKLAANNALDFISIHHFPNPGLRPLRVAFDLLDDLSRNFPTKPVVLEEFGYSNALAEPSLTALYETAAVLQLMSRGMAGGAKWSLYDVAESWNARESGFGIYRTDGNAKPLVHALRALGDYISAGALEAGKLILEAEPDGPGLQYVYSAPDALFVAAIDYSHPAGLLTFDTSDVTQVFVSWPQANRIDITATTPVSLRLNPGRLVGAKVMRDLALQRDDGAAVPFQRQGEIILFRPEAGYSYQLRFTPLAIDARIEIVWPHGDKSITEAERVNVRAYLFEQGTRIAICPELAPTVHLWRALNNGIDEHVGVGQLRVVSARGLAFAAWDFDNVEVAAAKDSRNKYYFHLSVDDYPHRSSIWSHGEDVRTYLPYPDVPTGIAAGIPKEIDAKIEIVWPHDNLSVNEATRANVVAYLFQKGTLQSVSPDWSPTVRLWRALNNSYAEEVAVGKKVMRRVGDLTFPSWEFNNVDVSAATDPLNKYHLRVSVDGVKSRTNVWSHGTDAKTYFPQQDVPVRVGACD